MSSISNNKRGSPFDFTERDRQMFERSYLTLKIVKAQGWWRAADSINGADAIGHKPTALKDYNGVVIVYTHPITGLERERVLRLDNPGRDAEGKEQGKYRGPIGRTNLFYIPLGVAVEWLKDKSIDVVFCEGEKKCLALWRIALENMRVGKTLFIPIGLRGVYGWRGRTGNRELPNGGHDRPTNPLNDFDFLEWKGRRVYILFDSNIHSPKDKTRSMVLGARKGLADHLHYILDAKVFFAEMTLEHFEQGINGPDDLAGSPEYGPDEVLRLLLDAIPAIKPVKFERERVTPEQREEQARAVRDMAGKSNEKLAADIFGSGFARHLLKLWAEAGFSDEAVRLLLAWEALAQGCDDLDYYYADLYELLYKCDGDEFTQIENGGRILKESCRKKLRDRIERLEGEMEAVGIRFVTATPGRLDEFDNVIQSNVKLYSRQYVAECLVLAESLPGYDRHKKESRNQAIRQFVSEKSGIAYVRKLKPRKNKSKQIADGLQCVKGRLEATLKRMDDRGDSDRDKWLQVIEILPSGLIDFIASEALSGSLPCRDNEGTPATTERADSPHQQARTMSDQEAEKGEFGVPSKSGVSDAESTDDFARFEKTCTKPARDPVSVDLWARTSAKTQAGAATIQWLKLNRPDAFDVSRYARPQDHPDYEAMFEQCFDRFLADVLADCGQGVKPPPFLNLKVLSGDDFLNEAYNAIFDGVEVDDSTPAVSTVARSLTGSVITPEQYQAGQVRVWREQINLVWGYIEQKKPLDDVRGALSEIAKSKPPDDLQWECEALLARVLEYEAESSAR